MVGYARDAMSGLNLAHRLADADERQRMASELVMETRNMEREEASREQRPRALRPRSAGSTVVPVQGAPAPPDLRRHMLKDFDLSEIFRYVNPVMLYVRHLGYRGRFVEALEAGDEKALELRERVQQVEDVMIERGDITANAVYQFYRAASEGDNLLILSSDGESILERFRFGRQSGGDGLCLSDYVLPRTSGAPDYVATFVTTVGPGVRELAAQWQEKGDYLSSYVLQVLALEGAEAFAELLHKRLRAAWGFSDPDDLTNMDLFKANYRGRRYSFGYPACPRLEDQEQLWRLLEPEKTVGVSLTEGSMMDPEGSVSALVMHHPQARYFNLSRDDVERLESELR